MRNQINLYSFVIFLSIKFWNINSVTDGVDFPDNRMPQEELPQIMVYAAVKRTNRELDGSLFPFFGLVKSEVWRVLVNSYQMVFPLLTSPELRFTSLYQTLVLEHKRGWRVWTIKRKISQAQALKVAKLTQYCWKGVHKYCWKGVCSELNTKINNKIKMKNKKGGS